MKKILALFLGVIFVVGLSACNKLPDEVLDCIENPEADGCEVCPEGQELDGTTCIDITDPTDPATCETGYIEVAGQCVLDDTEPETCQDGFIEVLGQCVPDNNFDPETVANAIVANWDGSMDFLVGTMTSMDFSEALTLTFEANFEVVEDVTETHYIDAMVQDSYLYEATGTTVKRVIEIDVDGDSVEFTMFLHEVEGGVHVFFQPALILDQISNGDVAIENTLEYMGFTNEWAVFEFDDSLENVIQMEVLREMFISIFLKEIGESTMTDFQENVLEEEVGFDLTPYGVDLGAIATELFTEDMSNLEALIDAINVEGIVLHLDYLYFAPELYSMLVDHTTALGEAGFDVSKLDLLDTLVYDEIENIDVIAFNPLTDPVVGTEAFFAALDQDDIDALIEVVIKPVVEEAILEMLRDNVDTADLEDDLYYLLYDHEYFLTNPEIGSNWGSIGTEQAELSSLGLVAYWEQLTETEVSDLFDATYYGYGDEWAREKLWEIQDRVELDEEVIYLLETHETELVAAGFNVDIHVNGIMASDLETYINSLTVTEVETFAEALVYPFTEDLNAAINDEEVFEFIMNLAFTNPHIITALGVDNYIFDEAAMLTNMVLIDLDAWELETMDYSLLIDAIYEGQTAFDTFVSSASPNWKLFLEPWSPAVLELEDFMVYVDDFNYAFQGLSAFDSFMDPSYYLDDVVTTTVEVVPGDFTLLTTIEMDGESYITLFNDFKDSLGLYLTGFETLAYEDFPFDENWECTDPTDDVCEDVDFSFIIANLYSQGSIELTALFDPTDLTWAEINFDATDFADVIIKESNAWIIEDEDYVPNVEDDVLTGVTNLTFTITLEEGASITLPAETETDNLNIIAEDLSKAAVSMFAFDYIRSLGRDFADYPQDFLSIINTETPLSTWGWLGVSDAFDDELSTVNFTVDMTLGVPVPGSEDFTLTLYWIDGTTVFDSPISLSQWATIMSEDGFASQAAYDLLVSQINDENWAMTKVFLMVMLEENER